MTVRPLLFDRRDKNLGARFLFILACLVVVVWGLRMAAPILVPFAFALFISILSLPVMFWLMRRKVPAPAAITIAVLVDVAIFGLLILVASQSFVELNAKRAAYTTRLAEMRDSTLVRLDSLGLGVSEYVEEYDLLGSLLNPDRVMDMATGTVQTAVDFVSNAFLVVIILFFILGEATVFPEKFRYVFGPAASGRGRAVKIVEEVQEYLGIKTLVSLATGLIAGLFVWWMGLDFPVLLGLIAFILNYVPTIGSIIAAIPAVLLALIQYGVGHAALIAIGYIVINTLFGNILEPNLMGRRLGLSTLVVILSLIFWGWTWGPLGALLAVPLTMIVRIMLENTEDLRWIAVLLDKAPPQVEAAGPANVDTDTGV